MNELISLKQIEIIHYDRRKRVTGKYRYEEEEESGVSLQLIIRNLEDSLQFTITRNHRVDVYITSKPSSERI